MYDRYLSTGVVERHRRESSCSGGWVSPKNYTTYNGIHDVASSLLFDNIFR